MRPWFALPIVGFRFDACSWSRFFSARSSRSVGACRSLLGAALSLRVPAGRAQACCRPMSPNGGRSDTGTTTATYSHGAGREKVEWLTHAAYLRWCDVGIRG
jgi:hypothetical protein